MMIDEKILINMRKADNCLQEKKKLSASHSLSKFVFQINIIMISANFFSLEMK